MVRLVKKSDKYGIMNNDNIIVPLNYDNKDDAIFEWGYLQKLNIEKPFLNKTLTIEEIDEIVDRLKSDPIELVIDNGNVFIGDMEDFKIFLYYDEEDIIDWCFDMGYELEIDGKKIF